MREKEIYIEKVREREREKRGLQRAREREGKRDKGSTRGSECF